MGRTEGEGAVVSGAGRRKVARWRAGMGAGALVAVMGAGALAGAAPVMAAAPPEAAVAADLPAVPMSFSATQGDQKINFLFDVPAIVEGPAVTGYEISIDNAVTWKPVETTEAVLHLDGRTTRTGSVPGRDDVVYRVALRALSADGPGPATAISSTAPHRGGPARRLSGPDRVATAVTVSQDQFAAAGSAPGAVLTTSATYADALAGAALAAKVGGPLLLTSPTALEPAVATEIRRVVEAGGAVYVLGDTGALTGDVETQLRPAYTVTRLAGADRFATARAIADTMRQLGAKGPAYLATGDNFPDGLAVSALAAHTDGLVVTTGDDDWQTAVAWIRTDDPTGARTVPVGGYARGIARELGAATVARSLVGADRYETSRRIAQAFGPFTTEVGTPAYVGLATGENWPDALVGAAAMARQGGPLLLTDGRAPTLTPSTVLSIEDLTAIGYPAVHGTVFGGADVLSDALADEFAHNLPDPSQP